MRNRVVNACRLAVILSLGVGFAPTSSAEETNTSVRRGFHSTGVNTDAQLDRRSGPMACESATRDLKIFGSIAGVSYTIAAGSEIKSELALAGEKARSVVHAIFAEMAGLKEADPKMIEAARQLDQVLKNPNIEGGSSAQFEARASHYVETSRLAQDLSAQVAAQEKEVQALLKGTKKLNGKAVEEYLAKLDFATRGLNTVRNLGIQSLEISPVQEFQRLTETLKWIRENIERLVRMHNPEFQRQEAKRLETEVAAVERELKNSLRPGYNPRSTVGSRAELLARKTELVRQLEVQEASLVNYEKLLSTQTARAQAAADLMADLRKVVIQEGAADVSLIEEFTKRSVALAQAEEELLAELDARAAQEYLAETARLAKPLAEHTLKMDLAYTAESKLPAWLRSAKAYVTEGLADKRRMATAFRGATLLGFAGVCLYETRDLMKAGEQDSDSEIAAAPASEVGRALEDPKKE